MNIIFIIFYIFILWQVIIYFNVAGNFRVFIGKNILYTMLNKNFKDIKPIKSTRKFWAFFIDGKRVHINLEHFTKILQASRYVKLQTICYAAFEGIKEATEEEDTSISELKNDIYPMLKKSNDKNSAVLNLKYVQSKKKVFKYLDDDNISEEDKDNAIKNLEWSCSFVKTNEARVIGDIAPIMLKFKTNDGLDATRLILPSFFNKFVQRFPNFTQGLIISVPSRDNLTVSPLLPQAMGIDYFLYNNNQNEYSRAAYPISDKLLYIDENEGIKLYTSRNTTADFIRNVL